MNKIESVSKIIIYDDKANSNLNLSEIKKYLESKLSKTEIIQRGGLFEFFLDAKLKANQLSDDRTMTKESVISKLAYELANAKVRDFMDPLETLEPLPGEIAFEARILEDPMQLIPGVLYDGFKLYNLSQGLLNDNEIDKEICHIILTPRLFGTFDKYDRRYHARVILCGYPSLISTSGIIEAPAKPKDYYKIKQQLSQQNITTIDEFVPKNIKEKYLTYNDPRITDVIKGYVMQSIIFQVTGEPFCDNTECRLFNAHWQEEMLNAQLNEPEFCDEHQRIVNLMNE